MTMEQKLRWVGVALISIVLWFTISSLGFIYLMGLWEAAQQIPEWSIPLQWPLYAVNYMGYYDVPKNLGMSALLSTGLVLAGLVRAGSLIGNGRPIHGETHWLTMREAKVPTTKGGPGFRFSMKPDPDAIILGVWMLWGLIRLYVSLPGEEHASLYARTRSGKGVGFVNPNSMSWGGSLLAFSIKADIWENTAAAREAMGDRVFVLNVTGNRTHRWNPLGLVRRGTFYAHADVQLVMYGLVPPTKAQNPYWDNAARRIAVAAGVLISETPNMKLNVNEVRKLVGAADYDARIRKMIDAARKASRPYPQAPVDTLLTWLDKKNEEGASSVRETLTTALQLWEDPRVQAATEVSDFDVSRIRSQRMSVFVCAEVGDIRRLGVLYGVFFDQFVAVNTREEYGRDPSHIHRCLVVLDEMWALGKRDIIADAAAFTASYGFRICYVLQAKSQIRGIFGEEGAKNLFLNTGVECLFGGTDQDTAEEISKRAGMDTITETTKSRPRFMSALNPQKQTESEAARRRALVLPQEISRMPQSAMIVLRPGFMPLRLTRIRHYDDPHYKPLGGPPPPLPELRVRVELDDVRAATEEKAKAGAAALETIRRQQDEKEEAEAAERGKIIAAVREAQDAVPLAIAAQEEAERDLAEAMALSAPLQEEARLARMASTQAARLALEAKQALEDAVRLGVVPPATREDAEIAEARARGAMENAARLAGDAAHAAQIVAQEKQRVSAATRGARSATQRAAALRKAAEDGGIDWRNAA
jgi:type IV secretion system protein VirD4